MKQMIKFPKIPQFRQAVREVSDSARFLGLDDDGMPMFDPCPNLPTLTFMGTPKLHGTNAAIAINSEEFWIQSRNNIITPEKDNAGFAKFIHANLDVFKESLLDLAREMDIDLEEYSLLIYGEWCGGNIQKGVSISGLEPMFVAFSARAVRKGDMEHKDHVWISPLFIVGNPDVQYYNITDYGYELLTIDFHNADASNAKLHELTNAVEEECPVGKAFGRVKGEDNTIGEGIVWVAIYNKQMIAFKVKGEKHSNTKVKKLPVVDEEKQSLVHQFVNEYACTPSRLQQIFDEVMDTINGGQPDIKKTGHFLKALVSDTMQEEHAQLEEMGLKVKDVTGTISRVGKEWMFKNHL